MTKPMERSRTREEAEEERKEEKVGSRGGARARSGCPRGGRWLLGRPPRTLAAAAIKSVRAPAFQFNFSAPSRSRWRRSRRTD
jgi:hypothetical protein